MRKIVLVLLLFTAPASFAQNGAPDAPRPNHKIFFAGISLLAAATTADAITTRVELNRGGSENNWEFGRHPSPGKQAGLNAAFFLGQAVAFHFTERSPHRWIRWSGRTMLALSIADHAQLAVCNAALPTYQLHGGCHSVSPF